MAHYIFVDGSGILYRNYFGLPELHDSEGKDVRVLFGFVKIMLTMLKKQPDYIAIARDQKGKTQRHEEFAAYKATRQAMPDDMARQIPLTQAFLADLGVPSYGQSGYEADDVLASWVGLLSPTDTATIMRADKDLKQLITHNVRRQDPFRNVGYTHADFVAEYGFAPEYFGTYLTLIGDASDNIPGVSGIGPKTALGLVQKYQTIDAIYENIDVIDQKVAKKLTDGKNAAYLSASLISLRPIPDLLFSQHRVSDRFLPEKWEMSIVHSAGFPSLAEGIAAVGGLYTGPQQVSLFG